MGQHSEHSGTSTPTSRRSFLRYAALAAATPILTEAHFARAAQAAVKPAAANGRHDFYLAPPADAVLINANENPMGPCQAARDAIARLTPTGGRYDLYGETDKLIKTFASQHHLSEDYISVYAGSSEPLHYTVLAFTSPTRSFVVADPSYEAGMAAATAAGAKIHKVPLTADHAHDIKAMVTADPNAGVLYICNPNNPTGTLTSKQDIVWALENKPKGSVLLVDEAYIHFADAPDVIDLVAADKDIIVLRTFSKIYGMAGLRCGFALARPDLLQKLIALRRKPDACNRVRCGERLAARREPCARAQEGDDGPSQREHRMVEAERLQSHRRAAVQLLHDRHRPQRPIGDECNAAEEDLHRPHMAHLAERRPHHGRNTRGDGQVPHGV